MRILLSSEHRYPASGDVGAGLHPKPYPSGSGYWIHDLLATGLVELGHEVFYLLRQGAAKPPPPGVRIVTKPVWDADILHTISDHDEELIREWQSRGKPWVSTCHIDMTTRGMAQRPTTDNWIFVSRTLARRHGRQRFVLNGIDPAACIYSETKRDYFLFMSSMDWEMKKGLDIAVSLAFRLRIKLVVAGTANNYKRIMRIAGLCRQIGAAYVGDVRGKRKAELLAGARAFLFPTRVDEAFGLGMAEALMSGTPVICSNKGACPEIISPDVGFVCRDDREYLAAIKNISKISPQACREKALRDFHYLRMAGDYVAEYEKEISRNNSSQRSMAAANENLLVTSGALDA
ncbi:MAG TPA: glycosyltransferase [Pyrinomonadaceae bacterium]|nr:glycosyltransferase [Pyrinomonadaceae bacterium]